MIFRRSFFLTFIVIGLFGAGFLAGYIFRNEQTGRPAGYGLFEHVVDLVRQHGLKPVPTEPALEYGMIRGMLQAYDDPYTVFVEPAQHELETNTLDGQYGGIGVRFSRDADNLVILHPFPDGPADEAGIQDGDHLLAVDQLRIQTATSVDEILAALRGRVNEKVEVTIGRPPDLAELVFSVRRQEIALPSVTWHMDSDYPQLGVIEINVIAATSVEEIGKAIDELSGRGATAFVLDLRDNYGGLLTSGVDIARLFLSEGTVIEQKFSDDKVETYRVEKPGKYADIPLAIIVNQNTASAAEIIAGAIKMQQRARIFGTPTYGKASVQLIFDLEDGSSLHVTSAEWGVPGLELPIAGHGIQPDVLVEAASDGSGRDAMLEKAAQYLFGER
jgi:carboxyl-terminal processing protease